MDSAVDACDADVDLASTTAATYYADEEDLHPKDMDSVQSQGELPLDGAKACISLQTAAAESFPQSSMYNPTYQTL